ncbi:MAG: hypothetical protein NTU57_02645 [Candidatus Aenigmarchaeota archaeon]|nr:hypothetical protein [Candidatus Aenigmarchaeota archaeon]
MSKLDYVLTEAYRDKNYEEKLTELFFEVMRDLRTAENCPAIENVRQALADANCFIESVVFSKNHLARYNEKVRPVMNDIRRIVFGNPLLPSVRMVGLKYGASVVLVRNKPELQNGLALVEQLKSAIFLVKQWAYEEGLFLSKPMDKRIGMEAIESTMQQ